MVGRYPTNYLIRRGPILPFPRRAHPVLAAVSRSYPGQEGTFPRVTHPSAARPEGRARLACVRPAASVRSEPGSNSQVETAEAVSLTSNLRTYLVPSSKPESLSETGYCEHPTPKPDAEPPAYPFACIISVKEQKPTEVGQPARARRPRKNQHPFQRRRSPRFSRPQRRR